MRRTARTPYASPWSTVLPAADAADITVRDLTERLYHADRSKPAAARRPRPARPRFERARLQRRHAGQQQPVRRRPQPRRPVEGQPQGRPPRSRRRSSARRFDGADLSDTSFLRPSTFSTLARRAQRGGELRRRQLEPRAPVRPLQPHEFQRRQFGGRHARPVQQDGVHRAHMAHGAGRRRSVEGQFRRRRSRLCDAALCQSARRQPCGRGAAQG